MHLKWICSANSDLLTELKAAQHSLYRPLWMVLLRGHQATNHLSIKAMVPAVQYCCDILVIPLAATILDGALLTILMHLLLIGRVPLSMILSCPSNLIVKTFQTSRIERSGTEHSRNQRG